MAEPIERFVDLFHHRWAVPVLVELARGRGAKFVTLVNRLGAGRQTLRATLEDLVAAGWVSGNPGHGHPLRPEYLLTPAGERLAPDALRLLGVVRRLHVEPLALRKWTMPVTYLLGSAPRRFSQLRAELDPVTPRALALSLKDMQETHLVQRDVIDDYPPITSYRLERRARPIFEALVPLAEAV